MGYFFAGATTMLIGIVIGAAIMKEANKESNREG